MGNNESPYCKVCGGCGEDGCCSALCCKHSKDGDCCEWYLKDLKFGYMMYKEMYELVESEIGKKKLSELFDKNYDIIYK